MADNLDGKSNNLLLGVLLGAAVLERSRHHVRLTPAGSVLLRETASLLQQLEESVRRVRRRSAQAPD